MSDKYIDGYREQINSIKEKQSKRIAALLTDYNDGFPPEAREAADEFMQDYFRDMCSNPLSSEAGEDHRGNWEAWVTSEILNQKDLETWFAVMMIEEGPKEGADKVLGALTKGVTPEPGGRFQP